MHMTPETHSPEMASPSSTVKILGLDPGLRFTGWGLIEAKSNHLTHLDNGTIKTPTSGSLPERLASLFKSVQSVLDQTSPDEVAVENTFVNKDGAATLKLGQARGVIVTAPALLGLPVAEYAPNQIKKTVVGSGHADKDQILTMVNMLLPQCRPDSEHAADALAIAITHAQHRKSNALMASLAEEGA